MKNEIDFKLILSIIIVVCFGVIFIFGYIIFDEISSAKKECQNLNGNYQLKSFNHFCDNKIFYKYSDGSWGFSNTFNWTYVRP